jgi:integrase
MASTNPRTKLTDRRIEAACDFLEGETRVLHDAVVTGLRIRVGRYKRTWIFAAEYQRKTKRGSVFKSLGHWPRMDVAEARRAALIEAAKVASGKPQPGKRTAITLEAACAEYLASLEARGKKSMRIVESMMRVHLLPDLGRFTLAELSDTPVLVRDLHRKISRRSHSSANRAMSILSAVYRNAARLDRSLSKEASPISAVIFNREVPKQSALPFDKFPKWRRAVDALPPIRAAYYRLMLLTGMRGGEAQRLVWSDVDLRTRSITLRGTKTGKDVSVPMSAPIVQALKLARPVHDGLIFPGARKWADKLPAAGHALRHTWRSVAADLGVDELQARLLLGHSLVGISQGYVTRAIVEGGPGLRAAQRRISRRIVTLLGRAE